MSQFMTGIIVCVIRTKGLFYFDMRKGINPMPVTYFLVAAFKHERQKAPRMGVFVLILVGFTYIMNVDSEPRQFEYPPTPEMQNTSLASYFLH